MNPWIRRLAMVLGILIPGLIMISLQVDPLILFTELGLIAIVILFASGSVTAADFQNLRKGARIPPVQEPAVTAKKVEHLQAGEEAGAKTSRFRAFSLTLGTVAAVARERWKIWRAGKSHVEAIDHALDQAVPASSVRTPPQSPSQLSHGAPRATPRGPGGDPFQDLLNANFEPVLLEDEVPAKEREKPVKTGVKPAKDSTVPVTAPKPEKAGRDTVRPGKEGTTLGLDSLIPVAPPKPEAAPIPPVPPVGPKKETTTVKNPTVKAESVSSLPVPDTGVSPPPITSPQAGTAKNGSWEIPKRGSEKTTPSIPGQPPAGGSPASSSVTVTVTETTPKPTPEAAAAPAGADEDILIFAPEAHGTMEDMLDTLRQDDTRVKRSDDSSLLRRLQGVQVQGKDLEDDLSALLKELK
ncbi:MAG: hypothetical protein LUO86_02205 [Methanomicrobiales archaeon]|nr:hypothetical protein [Methanomicrobiales archaeon]